MSLCILQHIFGLQCWNHGWTQHSIPKSWKSSGAPFARRCSRCSWTGLRRRRLMQCPAPPRGAAHTREQWRRALRLGGRKALEASRFVCPPMPPLPHALAQNSAKRKQAGAAGPASAAGEPLALQRLLRVVATREPDLRPPPPWVPWCRQLHCHLCAPVGSFWAQMQGALDYLSLVSDASGTLPRPLKLSHYL